MKHFAHRVCIDKWCLVGTPIAIIPEKKKEIQSKFQAIPKDRNNNNDQILVYVYEGINDLCNMIFYK